MTTDSFYGEVLADHNLHPLHKHELKCATHCCKGLNPTCGDNILLNLDIHDGIIADGSFAGIGCAISQASADIMLELIIGRSLDEARHYTELFRKMIAGEATDDEIEELEEAGSLLSISKMPARVKCALLSWNTMEKLIDEEK
ncbi:Fe-S cluster assembly sulfur transfer protein SufU [Ruminococcus sp. FC2018]|uniref:Fe-S cluster assembly sulfur transfer protein SufU n=1 Tax=Ruminococcus sp. FC2018 TaxID=1410617 RepID=UPI00048E42E8|nr:SUF system NifU family Fe-S cluster assembly protein [Ruminococcus sp. FC2018]